MGGPIIRPVATQSHADVHGTTGGCPVDNCLPSQSRPDALGTATDTAQSRPDALGTVCLTFGTAVDGHGNADGYGPDASGTQQAYFTHELNNGIPLGVFH